MQPQITDNIMKNTKQDSMSAVSRFGRDKRNRVTTAEHIERSPRPRRDADIESCFVFFIVLLKFAGAKIEKNVVKHALLACGLQIIEVYNI